MGGGSSVKERSRAQLAPTEEQFDIQDRERSSLLQRSSLVGGRKIASAARSYKGCDVWMGGGSSVEERSRAQLAPTEEGLVTMVAVP